MNGPQVLLTGILKRNSRRTFSLCFEIKKQFTKSTEGRGRRQLDALLFQGRVRVFIAIIIEGEQSLSVE